MISYGTEYPDPIAEALPEVERLGGVTVRLADVEPERVDWLWFGRLPLGKIVVLDGDPSVGKSTTAVDCAARVSTGSPWPDGADNRKGSVLLLSAEDGLADTIRPRLDAAGGDPSRVHALTEVRYRDDRNQLRSRPVTLADLEHIEKAVRATHAVLVIIDVLMAFMPGKIDSHRDQDVRGVLSGLAALAERTGSCVLLLRHLNKATGGSAMYRGGGSIGIIGAARVGLLAAVDPEDESQRVLAGIKSNLAPLPGALSYRLVDSPLHGCARVEWLGVSQHNAGTLLSAPRDDDERTERDEAVDWLENYLVERGGQAFAGEVIKAAARDGIAKTTLTRARVRAQVTSVKNGMRGGWVWNLDLGRTHEESEESTTQSVSSSVPSADSSWADVLPLHPEIAPCGHPALAVNTANGRCALCIISDIAGGAS